MFELTDISGRVLSALVGAPLAWQAPSQLAALTGMGIDETTQTLADLDLAGWITPWMMGETVFVTLTPGAAVRLGVRLDLIGRSEALRWRSIDDPEPLPPRASGKHEGISALNYMIDSTPGPEAYAIASEMAMSVIRERQELPDTPWEHLLPRPRLFIGSTLSPWPGPKVGHAKTCAACGKKPISEISYCLICDRWGLDHLLSMPRPTITAAVTSATREGQSHRFDSTAARKARRTKHRRKMAQKLAKLREAKLNPDRTESVHEHNEQSSVN